MYKNVYLAMLIGATLMSNTYADTTTQNIRLQANQQTINISLPANPSTGYQWFVQTYDHELLGLQNYRYASSSAPKQGMVGTGGSGIFTFTVDPRFYDAPQTTQVTFIYEQPWNPGQNASTSVITISSSSSNNDESSWQKYPDTNTPTNAPNVSETNSNSPAPLLDSPQNGQWLSLPPASNQTK